MATLRINRATSLPGRAERWRRDTGTLVAALTVVLTALPAVAQYRAAFSDPPWRGGWSDGGASTAEIAVWRAAPVWVHGREA